MSRTRKRIPSYLSDIVTTVKNLVKATVKCRCGDVIEVGDMRGCFNCPSCGNEIKIS